MTTNVYTLRGYADLLDDLADHWDGDQPVVLIGDVTGDLSVNAKDGHSKYGPVGYAQECFGDNGVWELGQKGDTRFFGTMLLHPEDLAEDALDGVGICQHCYHEHGECDCGGAEEEDG